MDIFKFLKKQPELNRKLKNYKAKDFEFIKNLKDRDMPFLHDKKFTKLIDVIDAVLIVQQELGMKIFKKRSKEIGYNVLDSQLAYGYYYGFCDAVIVTTEFRSGMIELFYLWINVVHRLTKVGNSPREFVDYFAQIQTNFLHDKKCDFYKGCMVGGQDAYDWMNENSTTIMGLVSLLEGNEEIKDK
jgi:hypothetical protein